MLIRISYGKLYKHYEKVIDTNIIQNINELRK